MWLDLEVPTSAMQPDWLDRTLRYIEQARRELDYAAFVAEVDGAVVGSVGCQRFAGLYPLVFTADYRLDGYIWGVYVEPAYRRRGIGGQLTQCAIAHLKSIGCTRAVLNASPMGKSVYQNLGFVPSNLMQLKL